MNLALALLLAALLRAASSSQGDDAHFNEIWQTGFAPLPVPLSDMTANTIEDLIYIVGGCDGHQIGYICTSLR